MRIRPVSPPVARKAASGEKAAAHDPDVLSDATCVFSPKLTLYVRDALPTIAMLPRGESATQAGSAGRVICSMVSAVSMLAMVSLLACPSARRMRGAGVLVFVNNRCMVGRVVVRIYAL